MSDIEDEEEDGDTCPTLVTSFCDVDMISYTPLERETTTTL